MIFSFYVFARVDRLSCSCPLLPLPLLVPGLGGEAECLETVPGEASVARVEAGVRGVGVVAALVIRVVL